MLNKNESSELMVFRTVFLHCIVIIVMPVVSFFVSKIFIFDGILNLDRTPSNVYAAAVSIVVLHIALGAFIYRAYFDARSKTQAKTD